MLGLLIPAGVRPERMSTVPLTEATIALVKAGTGVAVLARWVLAPHLAAGAVRALSLSARGLRRIWNMVALETEADDTGNFHATLCRATAGKWVRLLQPRGLTYNFFQTESNLYQKNPCFVYCSPLLMSPFTPASQAHDCSNGNRLRVFRVTTFSGLCLR